MRTAWDRRADRNPMFFIDSSRRRWSEEDFAASGRGRVEWALEWLGGRGNRTRLLEIGCGLARTSRAFAEHFARVDGADISPAMLRQAAGSGLPSNVHLHEISGSDLAPLADDQFDLVFSEHVFQHVPHEAVIGSYLAETARVLRAGGLALLQFDTRPDTLVNRALGALPDRLLPPMRRRHVRRYRRDPDRVRVLAREAGLQQVDERGAGTAEHWLMLERAPA